MSIYSPVVSSQYSFCNTTRFMVRMDLITIETFCGFVKMIMKVLELLSICWAECVYSRHSSLEEFKICSPIVFKHGHTFYTFAAYYGIAFVLHVVLLQYCTLH